MAVAIIQARLGSARLPGKVLEDIGGVPALEAMLSRASAAASLSCVAVACPDGDGEDPLAAAVASWGYRVFRGPVDDVLARVLHAATELGDPDVVRLTADCPLIDPKLIDQVVALLQSDPSTSYARTGHTFPDGVDVEAFRLDALRKLAECDLSPVEREHVTLGFASRPDTFPRLVLEHFPDLGHARMTVDEKEDLDVVRELVARRGADPSVSWHDYVAELLADPALFGTNAGTATNEGLWQSQCRHALDEVIPSRDRTRSGELLRRARAVFPQGTQTMSKAIDQFVEGVTPAFLTRGMGCEVWDVDGNAYIDYPMALGPIVLGYGHPAVQAAVHRQVDEGSTFTLAHPIEAEVAEVVCAMVPCAERVRFAKNGVDVTSAAVRLARAVTGRDRVLASGYHGWHDWYVGLTELSRGVPGAVAALTERLPLTTVEAMTAVIESGPPPAAVIIEVGLDPIDIDILRSLSALTERLGTVFIWDEVVTGFRWAPGGAQERYGVTPDLACLGKAMANGYPISALVGRAELMDELRTVFFSGTFGGETVSLAAAKATIEQIRDHDVCAHLWNIGDRFREGLRSLIIESGLEVDLLGEAPRSAFSFKINGELSPDLRGLFLQETVRRGVLFGGPAFMTLAHREEHIDRTLEACAAAFDVMSEAMASDSVRDRLDGPPPGVVFKPVR